jgi:hypothetical protein
MAIHFSYTTAIWEIQKKNSYMYMFLSLFQCTYTITVLAPVFTYPVISHIRILHVKCKIIGKVKMETTAMWGLTLIILKDIKCFQIWAYFEGIGISFNFENFQNKIFPLFILRTIQSMHARYHRTLQHLSKIEGWFVYTSFSLKC